LCPSFYRADIIYNPTLWDRLLHAARTGVIGALQRRAERERLRYAL
jgi:indolepyruvate ferredoxin oxidoreductase alpha subunit